MTADATARGVRLRRFVREFDGAGGRMPRAPLRAGKARLAQQQGQRVPRAHGRHPRARRAS